MSYRFKTLGRSEGDKSSSSRLNTPKKLPEKGSRKSLEEGECEPESPLRRLDRSKGLDAKKIKDSLKRSQLAKKRHGSSDDSDSDGSDSEPEVEGSFLSVLNAFS